jgi:hypothetical protein
VKAVRAVIYGYVTGFIAFATGNTGGRVEFYFKQTDFI